MKYKYIQNMAYLSLKYIQTHIHAMFSHELFLLKRLCITVCCFFFFASWLSYSLMHHGLPSDHPSSSIDLIF